MKRKILLLLTAIFLLATLFSPYSVFALVGNITKITASSVHVNNIVENNLKAGNEFKQVMNAFDSNRTFEIHYGDVENLLKVLNNVSSIEVRDTVSLDLFNNYQNLGSWDSNIKTTGIRLTLYAFDKEALLNVVNKLELPVYRLYMTVLGELEIYYPTGVIPGE